MYNNTEVGRSGHYVRPTSVPDAHASLLRALQQCSWGSAQLQGERHEPKFIAPHPAHDLSFCPLLLSSSGTPFSSTLKKHGARWAAPLAVRCGQFALILRAARPSSS